jgi:1-phosphatidylinositol-3-phosphate 5-kinase
VPLSSLVRILSRRIELTCPPARSLYAFGKFLELLVYSPAIHTLDSALCEHTTPTPTLDPTSNPNPSPGPNRTPDTARLNITRHFAARGRAVTFSLSTIDDVFELRVPRLQIVRGAGERAEHEPEPEPEPEHGRKHEKEKEKEKVESAKEDLRREMQDWWRGMEGQMDDLVSFLVLFFVLVG